MSFTEMVTSRNELEGSVSTTKLSRLLPALLAASIAIVPMATSEARQTYEVVQVSNTFSQTVEIRNASKRKRSALVRQLLTIRKKAISNGMPLLDYDAVIAQVKSRRGEEV